MRIPFCPKWIRTWSCLKDAQLAAYVDGTQPAGDRAQTEKHLSNCADCRSAVATLLRSQNAPSDVPRPWIARVRHLGSEQPRTAAAWKWVAATACVAVAGLGISVAYWSKPKSEVAVAVPSPVVESRGETRPMADEVRKSSVPSVGLTIMSPAEGQTLARGAQVQWEPISSAVDYEVRVLNSAGNTIWKSKTPVSHVLLPGSLATRPAEKYFVLISANLPNGKNVRAHAVSFHVRGEKE